MKMTFRWYGSAIDPIPLKYIRQIPGLTGDVRLGMPRAGAILFEPGKALAKAGAFDLPCTQFGMTKLGHHTHLYATDAVPEGLKPFGKWFVVLGMAPLNNRTMKVHAPRMHFLPSKR